LNSVTTGIIMLENKAIYSLDEIGTRTFSNLPLGTLNVMLKLYPNP